MFKCSKSESKMDIFTPTYFFSKIRSEFILFKSSCPPINFEGYYLEIISLKEVWDFHLDFKNKLLIKPIHG